MKNALSGLYDFITFYLIKFKYYIVAFVLGSIAISIAILFGKKSEEAKDAKVVKDILMKDKKDILNEALKNTNEIIEEKNNNIIILEDKIKESKEAQTVKAKEIEEKTDARELRESFKNLGF